MSDRPGASPDDRRARQRRAASPRGAAAVKQAFDEVLTRRRYAEQVGIHPTTLRRWEAAGVVSPTATAILGIPTRVYTETDVEIGRRVVQLLAEHAGVMSLEQAADAARAEVREEPARHGAGRRGREGRIR